MKSAFGLRWAFSRPRSRGFLRYLLSTARIGAFPREAYTLTRFSTSSANSLIYKLQSGAAEFACREKKPGNQQRPDGSDRIADRPRRASRVALRQQRHQER